MVEKAASAAVDALIERGVRELLGKVGKRRFTAQDLTILLLYDLRARGYTTEEAVRQGFERMDKRFDDLAEIIKQGFENTNSIIKQGFENLDKRLDSLDKRLDSLTSEIRGFREDMKPLWSALAKLVEAQAKT